MLIIKTANSVYVAVELRYSSWKVVKVEDRNEKSEVEVGSTFEGEKLEFSSGRVKLRGNEDSTMKIVLETSPYEEIKGVIEK